MSYPIMRNLAREIKESLTRHHDARMNRTYDLDDYALSHEILWYGAEAVMHAHLFRMAEEIINGEISLYEFIAKYELHDFSFEKQKTVMKPGRYYGFKGKIIPISNDGVFIPAIDLGMHCTKDNTVSYFDADYKNRLFVDTEGIDRDNLNVMIERFWTPNDLANSETVSNGLKFGRDLWKTCVAGFEDTCHRQPYHLTELGRGLIDYYDKIVD